MLDSHLLEEKNMIGVTYILLKAISGLASLNSSLPISLSSRFNTSPEERTTPIIIASMLSLCSCSFCQPIHIVTILEGGECV